MNGGLLSFSRSNVLDMSGDAWGKIRWIVAVDRDARSRQSSTSAGRRSFSMHINHAGIAGSAIAAIHQTKRFRNLLRSKLLARLLDASPGRNVFYDGKIRRILRRLFGGERDNGRIVGLDVGVSVQTCRSFSGRGEKKLVCGGKNIVAGLVLRCVRSLFSREVMGIVTIGNEEW